MTSILDKIKKTTAAENVITILRFYESNMRIILKYKRKDLADLGIEKDWIAIKRSVVELVRKINKLRGEN